MYVAMFFIEHLLILNGYTTNKRKEQYNKSS